MSVRDFFGGVLFAIMVVVLFWLYLIVTPDQYSAECEALRYEMEQAEDGVCREEGEHREDCE